MVASLLFRWRRGDATNVRGSVRANSVRGRGLCGGVSESDPHPRISSHSVREIPGRGFQLAAVEADIAQGAVIELVDAGKLGAKAKITPDGVEQKCSQHGAGFPLNMSIVWRHCSHW